MVNVDRIKEAMEGIRTSSGILRKNLHVGDCVFNASKTADDKALNGKSWIEYWKTMTGKNIPDVCPLCGLPLDENDADGCHIVFPKGIEALFGGMQEQSLRPKYIIPGHHKCNCQFNALMEIKFPVEACLAFDRRVIKQINDMTFANCSENSIETT